MRKSYLHKNGIYKGKCCTSKSSKIKKLLISPLHQVCHPCTALHSSSKDDGNSNDHCRNNDLVKWMRKNNCAARVGGTLVQFFEVVSQMTNMKFTLFTVIGWGFCDIRNNQGRGKCYQPQPSASADNTYLDIDYSEYHRNLIQ